MSCHPFQLTGQSVWYLGVVIYACNSGIAIRLLFLNHVHYYTSWSCSKTGARGFLTFNVGELHPNTLYTIQLQRWKDSASYCTCKASLLEFHGQVHVPFLKARDAFGWLYWDCEKAGGTSWTEREADGPQFIQLPRHKWMSVPSSPTLLELNIRAWSIDSSWGSSSKFMNCLKVS